MSRELFDRWCERGILALVLAILCFGPLAMGAVLGIHFGVIQALTVAALVLWMARFWIARNHRIQWPPVCWAVIAWVIYAIVRYHQADIEYEARIELIRILVYASLFFIVLNNLYHQETTQVLTYALLILGAGLSIYALYQYTSGSEHVWGYTKPPGYKGRASGTYICPNHLAGFLETLLPICLAGLFLGKASHVIRVLFGYVALLLMAGIAVTVSRGSYISVGLMLVIFFGLLVRYPAHRRTALISLLVIVAGVYLFLEKARDPRRRFSRMFESGQLEDTTIRAHLLAPTLKMWRDHFWVGVGPAHFDYRFRGYRPDFVQQRPFYAHNDYANALAEWGMVGGAIIGLSLLCLFAGAFRTWRAVHRARGDFTARRSNRASHVFGASLGIVVILIHSFVDFNMQIPANAILVVVLMATLSSHLRFATDRFWVSPKWLGRALATIVGVIAVAYLGQQGLQKHRQIQRLLAAQNAKNATEQMDSLKRAFAIEPMNAETAYLIGEAYRLMSWEQRLGWRDQAHEAMRWFDLAMRLNPWETYNWVRYGMCLDWLRKFAQAEVFFKQARKLDPDNYYIVALEGWHYLQRGDLLTARMLFKRSLQLKWWDNSIASSYLETVEQQLQKTKR